MTHYGSLNSACMNTISAPYPGLRVNCVSSLRLFKTCNTATLTKGVLHELLPREHHKVDALEVTTNALSHGRKRYESAYIHA